MDKTGAFFAADGDLVLLNELANVFEANRRFIQRNAVMLGQRINQVGGRDRFGHTVLPAAALDEVIEQQGDDVVWRNEGPVLVHDAESVSIAIGRDANMRARLPHLGAQIVEQMIVGLRSVSAEEHVAIIVYGRNLDAELAQQRVQ